MRLRSRRGQALVEFALVALVSYLLLAVTLELGRLVFSAQVLQDGARFTARELAVTPLPPESTLDEAIGNPVTPVVAPPLVASRIYDPAYLVVDLATAEAAPGGVDGYFATLPLLNQMLRPLMIFEVLNGAETLHYPGAVVDVNGVRTVLIPRIKELNALPGTNGLTPFEYSAASVEWLNVVEEPLPPAGSQFPASRGGLVVLRINYPYQAGMLAGYRVDHSAPFPPDANLASPILANDDAFDGAALPGGATFVKPAGTTEPGVHARAAGLGRVFVQGQVVRPFRKILSAQAVFRREVYGP